jgi:hypothetical protein
LERKTHEGRRQKRGIQTEGTRKNTEIRQGGSEEGPLILLHRRYSCAIYARLCGGGGLIEQGLWRALRWISTTRLKLQKPAKRVPAR